MIIAKKVKGLLLLYGFVAFAGIFLITIGIAESFWLIILGIAMAAISVYTIVGYLRTPSEIITADNKGMLHLPKDVILDPNDIIDVSYRRASGKGVQYRWGTVTIFTHIESFKFDYVDDCEEVSKELTRMMYESKPKQ